MVLGATGMLGHKLVQEMSGAHSVVACLRRPEPSSAIATIAPNCEQITGLDVRDPAQLERAIDRAAPDIVLNCAGIVKQQPAAMDPIEVIETNALFPRRLALLTRRRGMRLIHFSTDCVFSGRKGMYSELQAGDATDLYGRSKLLGEPELDNCLVLRSSIIGHELRGQFGLLEWFRSRKGQQAEGFSQVFFSGLTTLAIARLVNEIVDHHRDLSGLRHVASERISKFDLLSAINDRYQLGIQLSRNEQVRCDRSLDASKLLGEVGWRAEAWPVMVDEMYQDFHRHARCYGPGSQRDHPETAT
ncbi:MAG: SDR family oxidoreductase [Chitinophagaceae bacterium]